MNTFNISVFAKDANFNLTPDTTTEYFSTWETRFEEPNIPANASLVVRTINEDDEVVWLYRVGENSFLTAGVEDTTFLNNFPFQRDYLKASLFKSDEASLIEGRPDILTVVYGKEENMATMGPRESLPVRELTESAIIDLNEDILIDEVSNGKHYFLLFRNGELLLDKSRELIIWEYQNPALISTIEYIHQEDNVFPQNLASFF